MKDRLEKTNRTSVTLAMTLDGALGSLVVAAIEEQWLSPAAAIAIASMAKVLLLALLPDDVYRRIGRRLSGRGNTDDLTPPPPSPLIILLIAIGLALAMPSSAHATDARLIVQCSKTTTITPAFGEPIETCLDGDETAWVDFVVGAHVVAIQLTGVRKVLELGAAPSLGVLLAWRPVWWKATKILIAGELLLSASVLNLDRALTHLEIWTVAGLNFFGFIAIGVGGRYGISTTDGAEDFADLVLTSGFRVPI